MPGKPRANFARGASPLSAPSEGPALDADPSYLAWALSSELGSCPSCVTDHMGSGEAFRPLLRIMSLNTHSTIKTESVLLEYNYVSIRVMM